MEFLDFGGPSGSAGAWDVGVPYGSRTRVAAVKGRCPRPLDERDVNGELVLMQQGN